eukprot:scaffold335_cov253-Pinguiococcus_pyrenoidosus.AAC.2
MPAHVWRVAQSEVQPSHLHSDILCAADIQIRIFSRIRALQGHFVHQGRALPNPLLLNAAVFRNAAQARTHHSRECVEAFRGTLMRQRSARSARSGEEPFRSPRRREEHHKIRDAQSFGHFFTSAPRRAPETRRTVGICPGSGRR